MPSPLAQSCSRATPIANLASTQFLANLQVARLSASSAGPSRPRLATHRTICRESSCYRGLDNTCYNRYYIAMAIRIHDEIKQSVPFPRRESEAFVSILRTAAVIDHALDDALKPYGLTRTQYNVLRSEE